MMVVPTVARPVGAGPAAPMLHNGILTTIVLPAYNEATALPRVLADLDAALGSCEPYEIIVVDDGSTDGTAEAARQHPCNKRHPCRVIRQTANGGKGAALRAGFAEARGRYIIAMDADATYPAGAVPRMISLLDDNDLVRCTRQTNGDTMPLVNRIGNAVFDILLVRVLGLAGTDHLSGLYGLRRELLGVLNLEAAGFDIEVEIGIKARSLGLRVATFPVSYASRIGKKKLSPWQDGWRILSRILAMALLHNPIAMFLLPGLILMGLSTLGALVLREGPLITPYFGLSTNSFILAALGILAGFQLVIFGMATGLYGMEAGYRPLGWLVRLSSRPVRLGAAALGCLMVLLGASRTAELILTWTATGVGAFTQTRTLVLSSTSLVWGLQVLSAALFISIFAGRMHPPRPH